MNFTFCGGRNQNVTEGFSTFERLEHSTGTRRFNYRLTGGKLDSIATRLRERAVTSLEVRDQTTNWYSKGNLNLVPTAFIVVHVT